GAVNAFSQLPGCAGAAGIEDVNDWSRRTSARINAEHAVPKGTACDRLRAPPRRPDLAMNFGQAANGQRGELFDVHFHAAVGCRRHFIRKLRAAAWNLARVFVVEQGADRGRADVQGQYHKIGVVLERVLKTIIRYSMFKPGDRVGVAVSGGADSVFLLYAL